MSILLLDNYDSFTFNLVHLLEQACAEEVVVVKNDRPDFANVSTFSRVVLSPGPGLPSEAGCMPALLHQVIGKIPVLGVCLGMQAIAEHFDSPLKNLQQVVHGKAENLQVLTHDPLFQNCPSCFKVGRYHSWVIDKNKINSRLLVLATDDHDNIMAIKHEELPVYGVQFHPESILSEYGLQLVKNWINT